MLAQGLVCASGSIGAAATTGTNGAGQSMIEGFLARQGLRLDGQFLEGISNREQWEAIRPKLRQEYLEMLGLWPLAERTPLEAHVTGTIEREEGFRVEKLYFQSRPHLYVTGDLYLARDALWIAAADDRVKVAVPVSGMSDLEDYAGEKIIDGHCDCMFLINAFQWPWTYIAALIAPRPMLFENSGHDTIFPMDANERIRGRLDRLYGFYTNRADQLFDIGNTPGGHNDNPELRLMAYRRINWHLKGDNAPVTEPPLPPIESKQLRAFPDQRPADELNSRIDETFVPPASNALPASAENFARWRENRMAELRRIVFRSLPEKFAAGQGMKLGRNLEAGEIETAPGITAYWKYFPAAVGKADSQRWLAVLGPEESFEQKPPWLEKIAGGAAVLLVAPRGAGPTRWQDPPPYAIERSLPLLGQTVDGGRLEDVLAVAARAIPGNPGHWSIAGNGPAGVIGA
jgi:hypothetical protein